MSPPRVTAGLRVRGEGTWPNNRIRFRNIQANQLINQLFPSSGGPELIRGYMPTILLVDNDPLQAFSRKSILERKFGDVQRVGDAAEALCLVEQPQFAGCLGLVISGLHMPGISGPAFVAELHERMPALPVLVLGGGGEIAGDYAGGWVRFLSRPCAGDEMLAAADELLAPHA